MLGLGPTACDSGWVIVLMQNHHILVLQDLQYELRVRVSSQVQL